jgi:hypothetical protein
VDPILAAAVQNPIFPLGWERVEVRGSVLSRDVIFSEQALGNRLVLSPWKSLSQRLRCLCIHLVRRISTDFAGTVPGKELGSIVSGVIATMVLMGGLAGWVLPAVSAFTQVTPGPPRSESSETINSMTKEKIFAELVAFEKSDLPSRLEAAHLKLNTRLDALLAKPDPAISAGVDLKLPHDAAREALGVCLYSLWKLGAEIHLPEALRSALKEFDEFNEQTMQARARARRTLFPPTVHAYQMGPLNNSEMDELINRFQRASRAWDKALSKPLDHLEVGAPFEQVWRSDSGRVLRGDSDSGVLLQLAKDSNGRYHLAQLYNRFSITVFRKSLHQQRKHLVLQDGVLRLVHEPLVRNLNLKRVFGPEDTDFLDPDYPISANAPPLLPIRPPAQHLRQSG